jgi:hypothetical protein
LSRFCCASKQISGVVDVTCGTQEAMYPAYADRTAGYTHAMIIRLIRREDLEAYDTHPVHLKFRVRAFASIKKPCLA